MSANNFADATAIVFTNNAYSVSGVSNAAATREPSEPLYSGYPDKTLWWKFTAPANSAVTVSTLGSSLDTVLVVYTGTSVSSLTQVAFNDDDSPRATSRLTFDAISDITYYIQVGTFAEGAVGTYSLAVSYKKYILQNTAEGGTNGTSVTSLNSGGVSGDAFSFVPTFTNGGDVVFDNTKGSMAYKIFGGDPAAQAVSYVRWDFDSAVKRRGGRFSIYLSGSYYAQLKTLAIWVASELIVFYFYSGGNFVVSAGGGTIVNSPTNTIPFDQWVRFEFDFNIEASTYDIEIYPNQTTTTPLISYSGPRTYTTNYSMSPQKVQWGTESGLDTNPYWLDNLQINDTGLPGPYIPPSIIIDGVSATFSLDAPSGSLEVGINLAGTTEILFNNTASLIPDRNAVVDLYSDVTILVNANASLRLTYVIHLVASSNIPFITEGTLDVGTGYVLVGNTVISFDNEGTLDIDYPNFIVEIDSPVEDKVVPTVYPAFRVTVQQQQAQYTTATVQIQISTDEDFTSTTEFQGETSSVTGAVQVFTLTDPALVDGISYYWRARSLPDDGSTDPWSSVGQFSIDLTVGNTAAYGLWGDVVDTGTVIPQIWYVADDYLKTSDTLRLVGMGFGDKIATIHFGEDVLTPLTNVVIAADADGLSDARTIDSVSDYTNIEHDEITAVVTEAVESPGDNVYIETV